MNKDITPRNDNHKKHGYWERYWNSGKVMYKCFYINGKGNGYEEWEWEYNANKVQLTFHL